MTHPLDIFESPSYCDQALTRLINVRPDALLPLDDLGMFPVSAEATTYVRFSVSQDGALSVLPFTERGGPATKQNSRDNARQIVLPIPHISHEDGVMADDVQNRLQRAFDQASGLMMFEDLVTKKLASMRAKHMRTLEFHRISAMKGQIIDPHSNVVKLDIFAQFGVAQQVLSFGLNTAGTVLVDKAREIDTYFNLARRGVSKKPLFGLCGRDFATKLRAHKGYLDTIDFLKTGIALTAEQRDPITRRFTALGIEWMVYDEDFTVLNADGTTSIVKPVGVDEAYVFMKDAVDDNGERLDRTYNAPPDVLTEVNRRPTDLLFVQTQNTKWDTGREMRTQGNYLPVYARPDLVIKLTAA